MPFVAAPARRSFVLITGASTGIGYATALRLAGRGIGVFAGVRSGAAAATLESAASGITPLRLDVTSATDIATALEFVGQRIGNGFLSGLVNNAAMVNPGPFETLGVDSVRRVFEVNLFGAIALTNAFLPLLRAAAQAGGHPRIANVSSIGGRIAFAFTGGYDASKFALTAWSQSLRMELRPWQIPVALIEPGTTRTAIWPKVAAALDRADDAEAQRLYPEALAAQRRAVAQLSRMGSTADRVACAIEHALCSRWPRSRYLTGNARVLRALAWLPDRWREALLVRVLRLPG